MTSVGAGAALAAPATTRATPGGSAGYRKIVEAFFFMTVAVGSIVMIEPSPYDFFIVITVALWSFGGFVVHRAVAPMFLFLSLWVLGGFLALVPYWNETDPVAFMYHTLFIASTGYFYALFLSQHTARRAELMFIAYVVSCVIAATIAIVTWYGAFGQGGDDWVSDGRAMAPFKDPNVLGSYLILGVLYLVQTLLRGRLRWIWLIVPILALIMTAQFLSFSRGSWGATVLSILMVATFLFLTADSARLRARILAGALGVFLIGGIGVAGALSDDSLREFFFQRAKVEQDYDGGPNGRFGNQYRSLPMLIERPLGFGPLRYRLTFDLDTHNSYVNAFASNGWLGGFAFLMFVGSTCFVGFRQCLTRHPWSRQSQVLFSAAFVYFLQGLQIDIDHWRMSYLAFGGVWGVEAARRRWLAQGRPTLTPGYARHEA